MGSNEDYQKFMAWRGKQEKVEFDAEELLKFLTTKERLADFLELFQAEVAKATMAWISNNLDAEMGDAMEEAELEVFTGEVVDQFKEGIDGESEG